MPSTCGTNAASHATRRSTSGDSTTPVAVEPSTSPAPVRASRSVNAIVTCNAAELPGRPVGALPVRIQSTASGGTPRPAPPPAAARPGAGPAPRSPRSGPALDIGPIAASSAAACSGVITSWYSVRSPDSTHGCDNRAAARQPGLQVVELPRHPVRRHQRRAQPAHLGRTPARPQVQQGLGHRRHRLRDQHRLQPGHLTQRASTPDPGDTVRVPHPGPHHTPTACPGPAPPRHPAPTTHPHDPPRPPRPPAWRPDPHRPAATTARTPAPTPARSARTAATTPRRTASAATWARTARTPAPPAHPPRPSAPPARIRRLTHGTSNPTNDVSGSRHRGAPLRQTQPPRTHAPS